MLVSMTAQIAAMQNGFTKLYGILSGTLLSSCLQLWSCHVWRNSKRMRGRLLATASHKKYSWTACQQSVQPCLREHTGTVQMTHSVMQGAHLQSFDGSSVGV